MGCKVGIQGQLPRSTAKFSLLLGKNKRRGERAEKFKASRGQSVHQRESAGAVRQVSFAGGVVGDAPSGRALSRCRGLDWYRASELSMGRELRTLHGRSEEM